MKGHAIKEALIKLFDTLKISSTSVLISALCKPCTQLTHFELSITNLTGVSTTRVKSMCCSFLVGIGQEKEIVGIGSFTVISVFINIFLQDIPVKPDSLFTIGPCLRTA